MTLQEHNLVSHPDSDTLVVLLHGLGGTPDRMGGLAEAARDAFPNAATYSPRLPHAWQGSVAKPEAIASDLLHAIDYLMRERSYKKLILVGHSMGSLLARKIAVLAHGESSDAPFEPELERWREPRAWANTMNRVVLTSGILRGWSNEAAQGALVSLIWSFCAFFGDLLVNGRWTALQMRVGTPFVVQTRLQWLALMRRTKPPKITTVQLLGSLDNQVAPEDTVDFLTKGESANFVMLQLPETNHSQAIEVTGSPIAEERRKRFQAALTAEIGDLSRRDYCVPNRYVTNGQPPEIETDVSDVVFVIHGIRDRGFWTQKIAHQVMAEAEKHGRVARSMTLSYGYLAMGPFLLPWVRREKVRWLMDRYAECQARYPDAEFHYVGHSNGTYLAARALADYPAARFKHVVFAGSVVRTDYDWTARTVGARRQVDSIMNYVASADWVVAIFPNGLTPFRAFDLGGAGHHGFDQAAPSSTATPGTARVSTATFKPGGGTLHQIDYVAGSHAAGIKESQWDDIAHFVVTGNIPPSSNQDFVPRQTMWVRAAAALPPAAFTAIVLLVISLIASLVTLTAWLVLEATGSFVSGLAFGTLALVALLYLVRLVITRL